MLLAAAELVFVVLFLGPAPCRALAPVPAALFDVPTASLRVFVDYVNASYYLLKDN